MNRFTLASRAVLGATLGAFCMFFLGTALADDKPATDDLLRPVVAGKTYIGALKDSHDSARIALVADANTYLLYICSQDQATNQALSRWVQGKVGKDGSFVGASADGVKVTGDIKEGVAEGNVTGKDGKELSFRAKMVAESDRAGLYRREFKEDGAECVAGWIVDADGRVAGAVFNKKTKTASAAATPLPGKNNPGAKLLDAARKRGTIRGVIKAVHPEKSAITLTVDGTDFLLPVHPKANFHLRNGDPVKRGLFDKSLPGKTVTTQVSLVDIDQLVDIVKPFVPLPDTVIEGIFILIMEFIL
jgi:hypothetical protein